MPPGLRNCTPDKMCDKTSLCPLDHVLRGTKVCCKSLYGKSQEEKAHNVPVFFCYTICRTCMMAHSSTYSAGERVANITQGHGAHSEHVKSKGFAGEDCICCTDGKIMKHNEFVPVMLPSRL